MKHGPLQLTVGVAALVAPLLHSLSDAMEWYQGGFSTGQLWLNYVAFLPMPWLLLGLYALHPQRLGFTGLLGAFLYGAAFTYFAHTTLYALAEQVPDYASMWTQIGIGYTIHGALMVAGGLMFGWAAWHAGWLPRAAITIFVAGVLLNLLLTLLMVPDLLQVLGSALRNVGLAAMGYAVLFRLEASRA